MLLADEAATEALGGRLGGLLAPGDVVALVGDLGAGKSTLARAVARALGVTGRIPSPTFVVVATYDSGRVPVAHVDLYRVEDPGELDVLGLDELFADHVVLVEWADRHPDALPADRLTLALAPAGPGRRVALDAGGPRARAVLAALSEGARG